MLRLLQPLSWWIALVLMPIVLAGEQKPLALSMVPGAVLKAIERKLPGFEPDFIEVSHSRSLKVVRYEFVGKLGDKKLDIDVSADGCTIEVADQ